MELEESGFLMLNYTTKLHSSKQCGTGTEAGTRSMEQDRKPRRKKNPTQLWSIHLQQMRQEYTMKKRMQVHTIGGTGKTRQLHAEE